MSLAVAIALVMAAMWLLVYGEVSLGQALLGLIFGSVFVLVTGVGRRRRVSLAELPARVFYLGAYLLLLIPYDVVRSNLDMASRIARLKPALRPGIVRVALGDVSHATAALIGHAITMSPGEMVVDYAEDGRTIYVHLIDVSEARAKEASFWRRYHRLLQRVFP